MTEYIYLLQLREFLNTDIYKIGMTKNNNLTRFNQYPKGSVLQFQLCCKDCKKLERDIIKIFKAKFKQRKDYGNEYFQGDLKEMTKIIFKSVNDEVVDYQNDEENDVKDEVVSDEDKELVSDKYTITTYEEWIKYSPFESVIITSKKGKGYIKFKGSLWLELHVKNDMDETRVEDLMGFVSYHNNNQPVLYKNKSTKEPIQCCLDIPKTFRNVEDIYNTYFEVEYDNNKICKDIIKKCFNKEPTYYIQKYNEYDVSMWNSGECIPHIFDSLNFRLTPVTDIDCFKEQILIGGCRFSFGEIKNSINDLNTIVVDNILDSLITVQIKSQYKKLMYNLLVKNDENEIIFYDDNECFLSSWTTNLLLKLTSDDDIYQCSRNYYKDKKEFKKQLKNYKPKKHRCIIINTILTPIETQIKDFRELGFKIFIIQQKEIRNSIYDIVKYKKFLIENQETIINYIQDEEAKSIYRPDDIVDYDIFELYRLLVRNFLKWCCV
jgi:hypothetical protein